MLLQRKHSGYYGGYYVAEEYPDSPYRHDALNVRDVLVGELDEQPEGADEWADEVEGLPHRCGDAHRERREAVGVACRGNSEYYACMYKANYRENY